MPRSPKSPEALQKAVTILEGMEQIAERNMLIHGRYVTPEVHSPELAQSGAICRGHKACAIGSLYLAGGVKMTYEKSGSGIMLADMPGVDEEDRAEFLRNRPALRAAYDALNEAADRFIKRNGVKFLDDRRIFNASIEALFEEGTLDGRSINAPELTRVIKSARRSVERKLAQARA